MRAVLSLVLVVSITAVATAQPTGDKPDFNRAAELYKQAEAEMASSQYADAARDYAIAFDITKDPVLFFKIASANDKAGRCDLALTYYRRYLNEGKPNDAYKKLTTERITVCEKATGTSVPDTTGDSGASSTTTTDDAATGAPATDDATAQPGGERPSLTAEKPNRKRSAAWILLGVGVAFGTVGAVSAMSAEAAEKDLQDLYDIRVSGRPVEYTADIQEREKDLIAQGDRYQKLSWAAFGVAGAALAGATVLFVLSRGGDEQPPPVAVHVTGTGATVSGGWSF